MVLLELTTDVSSIKGVGPAWARKLTELGIKTVEDLLLHFPFRFDLRKQAQPIASLKFDGTPATVAGEVISAKENSYSRRLFFQAAIRDDTGTVHIKWFGGGYLRDKIKIGAQLAISGKPSVYREQVQFVNPQFQIIYDPEGTNLDKDELLPVYPAGKQLTSRMIGSVVKRVLDQAEKLIPRWFDAEYLEKRGLGSCHL